MTKFYHEKLVQESCLTYTYLPDSAVVELGFYGSEVPTMYCVIKDTPTQPWGAIQLEEGLFSFTLFSLRLI